MAQNKIFVRNMSFATSAEELQSTFAEYGDIDDINIITDRLTGRSRGFAFITFVRQQSAETALKLNGTEVNGRKLEVSMAKEKEKGNRRHRGYRR